MGGGGEKLDDLKEQGGNVGPRDIAYCLSQGQVRPNLHPCQFQGSSDLPAEVFPEL